MLFRSPPRNAMAGFNLAGLSIPLPSPGSRKPRHKSSTSPSLGFPGDDDKYGRRNRRWAGASASFGLRRALKVLVGSVVLAVRTVWLDGRRGADGSSSSSSSGTAARCTSRSSSSHAGGSRRPSYPLLHSPRPASIPPPSKHPPTTPPSHTRPRSSSCTQG